MVKDMIFAVVDGIKQKAEKGKIGLCPLCDEQLIPKCGNYKIHHWSHKNGSDCDSWAEGETEWHLKWKSYFPESNQEVTIVNELTNEKHRADIKTNNNMVIELQNSPITDDEIQNRTVFYGKMIWIVNGKNYGFVSIDFFNGLIYSDKEPNILEFHYYGRSKIFEKWSRVGVPVFIDFDTPDLYWIKKYDNKRTSGIVQKVSKDELVEKNGGMIPIVIDETVNIEISASDKNENRKEMNYLQRTRAYLNRNKNRF